MRIALDARTIYAAQRRGTGRNLIDLYTELAVIRPDWWVVAYHRSAQPEPNLLPGTCEPRWIEAIGDRLDAWQRWRLPLAAWRDGADLLHCPANTAPAWMPVPTLVTIHDLIPLDIPEEQTASTARQFEQSVRGACRHAAGIICPSQYTRDRLVEQFGASPRRVTVNHWAADHSMGRVPMEACRPVLRRYGLEDATAPYALHLGAASPRKNTRRVIEAWSRLDADARGPWTLLIVGLDDKTLPVMRDAAKRHGVSSSVRLNGFADAADLPALLSAAGLLAYPSLSEGFGLPLLDAWTTHTPVLTSNTTSLPEIAGDAALAVNPSDVAAIAAGLGRMIEDGGLRQELAARGRRRVQQFTWRATAERFAHAIEQATGIEESLRGAFQVTQAA